jgi:hypothetical protein
LRLLIWDEAKGDPATAVGFSQIENYLETAFFPAIIMAAPAAIKTALMMGETFSSCRVSMPMEAPPTLTPERSLSGMGTTSEAIPKTTSITPSQNKPLMVFSFLQMGTRSGPGNSITGIIWDASGYPEF